MNEAFNYQIQAMVNAFLTVKISHSETKSPTADQPSCRILFISWILFPVLSIKVCLEASTLTASISSQSFTVIFLWKLFSWNSWHLTWSFLNLGDSRKTPQQFPKSKNSTAILFICFPWKVAKNSLRIRNTFKPITNQAEARDHWEQESQFLMKQKLADDKAVETSEDLDSCGEF